MKRDPIAVLEAAYRLRGGDYDWLRGVRAAVGAELDSGFGVLANTFAAGPEIKISVALTDGCSDAFIQAFHSAMQEQALHPPVTRLTKSAPLLCITLSQALGSDFLMSPHYRDLLKPNGIEDILGILATDTNGHGCSFNVGLPRPMRVGPRMVRRWTRITAHVLAGLRLRRVLAARSLDPFSGAEAVLASDGAFVHAEPAAASQEARTTLRRGARAIDRARGKLRRADPDEALAVWRGLVAGRWSLLDHVDRDGKRFFLARRNDPEVGRIDPLTLSERQVASYAALGHANKLIAYELGLTETAVAMRLHRAQRKLGARTRVELVRLVRERFLSAEPSSESGDQARPTTNPGASRSSVKK